jgi:hypothetical protein
MVATPCNGKGKANQKAQLAFPLSPCRDKRLMLNKRAIVLASAIALVLYYANIIMKRRKVLVSKTSEVQINKAQLLLAFEYLNVKELHKAALTDVIINGSTSYEAEKIHNLSPETLRAKVLRLEAYFRTCKAFTVAATSE